MNTTPSAADQSSFLDPDTLVDPRPIQPPVMLWRGQVMLHVHHDAPGDTPGMAEVLTLLIESGLGPA